MMNKSIKLLLLCSLMLFFIASMAGYASSQVIFPHDVEISGGTAPQGSTPWVTATFIDVTGGVQLTMSTSNLVNSEFVTGWYFNFNPSLTLSDLSISLSSSDPGQASSSVSIRGTTETDSAFKADGDGYFDFRFDFQTANTPMSGRFMTGEKVVYDLTYSGAGSFSSSSFNFKSVPGGGSGQYESVAKVQGINGSDSTSGWVANTTVVPEPVSSTLFIIGGITLGFRRFRNI